MSFLDTQAKNQKAGNQAGYVLDFFKIQSNGHVDESSVALSVSSDNYFTKVEATMPATFSAGRYVFEIEGLTDADYAKIAPGNTSAASVIKLYLYWGDVINSVASYFTNFVKPGSLSDSDKPDAIVAVLQILKVSRTVGENRYITKVEAIERVFYQCRNAMTPSHEPMPYRDAIQTLCQAAVVDVDLYPASGNLTNPPSGSGAESFTFVPADTIAKSLRDLGNRVQESSGKFGRGMLMIRDGKLVFGVRPIPYPMGTTPVDLLASNGLVKVELTGSSASDPFSDYSEDTASTQVTRPSYSIVLKGRPDLKPGMMVRFDLSPENTGDVEPNLKDSLLGVFAGSFAATEAITNPKWAYIESVQHRLGREQGFITTLACIGVPTSDGDDAWDGRTPVPAGAAATQSDNATSADPAERAATAIRRLSDQSDRRVGLDVAEVRSFVSNSAQEPTSQTEVAWCGLINADGRPNQSRRLPISRQIRVVKEGIPYVSPFAWGKCGLILPRYPGMRVAVGFRNGAPSDAIDLGGIYETGKTGTNAQPGDYWLSLPAKVPASQRQQLGESDTPQDYSDAVSNDLIDADGHRVIEVGEFTVRVNELSALKKAGERPARASIANSITIEHAKGGSSIVLKDNGDIIITGKNITLDAGSGNINLKASKVDVAVSSEMNVH